MRAPAFWTKPAPGLLAGLLAPAAFAYGAVAAARMARPGERAEVPVACVGNFTLGGAGKTPTALAIAELLAAAGERPVFLTRGHGGAEAGPILVEPGRHGAAEVGDEALLLAKAHPTIVARDRPLGAAAAVALAAASVVVMDDGLQNPSLAKDLSLVVVDGPTGVGNGRVFPAGPLRAPIAAQWLRVDAAVLMGDGEAGAAVAAEASRRSKLVFRARLAPDPAAAERLAGRRVLAFAGIGRPEKMFSTLEAVGAVVAERVALPDHHVYRPGEAEALVARARRAGLVPVTTEKDAAKLAPIEGLETLPVRAVFDDPEGVARLLAGRLARARASLPQPAP